MDRRDFLAAWIHILLLSIFPWLRPKPEIAKKIAEELVARRYPFEGGEFKITTIVRGYEVDQDWYEALQMNPELREQFLKECGVSPCSPSSSSL